MKGKTQIAVLANPDKDATDEIVDKLKRCCDDCEADVEFIVKRKYDSNNSREIERISKELKDVSLMISIGGDGTLLHALRLVLEHETPVMPVYNGTLGFIAELTVDDSLTILREFLNSVQNSYSVEERSLIKAMDAGNESALYAVNELVINKGNSPRLAHMKLSIDGEHAASLHADGLIISSATGSTAYALSAGGPIIDPSLDVLGVVPLAAHSLTFRPIILAGTKQISIECLNSDSELFFSVDGMNEKRLAPGNILNVRISKKKFSLLKPKGREFYKVIKDKLNWGK